MTEEKCTTCHGLGYLKPDCAGPYGTCDDYECPECTESQYDLGFAAGVAAARKVLDEQRGILAVVDEKHRGGVHGALGLALAKEARSCKSELGRMIFKIKELKP